MSPRVIVFEGIDGAGKDTIRKLFGQRTGERFLTVARFIWSQMVYAKVFGRKIDENGHWLFVNDMERNHGMLSVFLDTPPEVCWSRRMLDRHTLQELTEHRDAFLDFFYPGTPHRRIVCTEGLTPEQIVDEIIGWVKSVGAWE